MGLFFIDTSINKPQKLELARIGFVFVDIFDAEIEDPNLDKEFYLQVEKIEVHSVESLLRVNEILYAIAREYDAEYDGFDVGAIV